MSDIKCTIALLIFVLLNAQCSHGKLKILALMPYNGKSHFDFAEVIFEELAARGHDVTVVSRFPKDAPPPNYRDISIAENKSDGVHTLELDVVAGKSNLFTMSDLFSKSLHQVCVESLFHPEVRKLNESNESYDIVITEMFTTDCFLGFVHRFNASLVLLRTSALPVWLTERTGCSDNPSFIPGTTTGSPSRMNFWQRIRNTFHYVVIKGTVWYYDIQGEKLAKQFFGDDMPNLKDIAKNASLFLLNTHFVHQYPKPLMPNIKEVAGLHVRKPKPLPDDLENWISAGRRGTIYLSLGSMLKSTASSPGKRQAFLRAFGRLDGYRVLMKWSGQVDEEEVPENVRIEQWTQQNDVLHHPNVKLFITHAGMLGSIESIHAGVPMIAIPIYGDQPTNARLLEERGLAIVLNYYDITEETLTIALETVLTDSGFTDRAKQLSAAFHDRPVPPLEEAMYWIEHVGRYRNSPATAQLMRSAVVDLALYQYLLLDVLAVVLMGLVVVWLSLRVVVKLAVEATTSERSRAGAKKKNR